MDATRQIGLIVAGIALFAARLVVAAPITEQGAVNLVSSWSQRRDMRGQHRHRAPSGDVKTISEGGTDLFHLVALDGGGFAAVAADDSRPPIMAFSPSGDLPDPSEGGPLWALLGADGAAAAGLGTPRKHADHRKMKSKRTRFRRKQRTTSTASVSLATATSTPSSLSSISDVRVAPLVASKWDQKTAGGKNCYNYYTPQHWYCGCVATAMAQIMRYHSFPTASIQAQTFTCYSNSIPVELTMKGGTYDWAHMPLVPDYSITDVEREAIGKLCYDVGVAMRMKYAPGGSGALGVFAHGPFVEALGYDNAESFLHANEDTLFASEIEDAVLANLDAGYPVLLGIVAPASSGKDAGHAIVADGYGYEDGTLWCHLNLGWSGSYDLWYALPNIPAGGYAFSIVSGVVYNIFPKGTGQLITGRVTDENGNALSNATVTASYKRRFSTTSTNVLTSANGIYAFRIPIQSSMSSTKLTVTLTARYGAGATTSSVNTTASKSSSPFNMDFDTGNYSYSSSLSIGNSWGNDLTVVAAHGEAAEISEFSVSSDAGGDTGFLLSFNGTAGARYTVEWCDSLTNVTWRVWTNILMRVEGPTPLHIPFDPLDESGARFFRVVPTP